MKTSIHIRLNEATGKRFVKKLQDLGYSVMPNDKRSYYMHNASDGRVLVEDEPSSDIVIKGFWPKFATADIVDLLEKTARAAHGDFYLDDEQGTEISIVQGLDAPQPAQVAAQQAQQAAQQAQQQQPAPQMQSYNGPMNTQPMNIPQGNANMNPAFYQKLIMDGMGRLMQMFAMGHTKADDIYMQATRIQGAAWIMSGLTANFLTPNDVNQLMNDTKQAIAAIPQEISNAQQHYQQNQQNQQAQQTMGSAPILGSGDPFASQNQYGTVDPNDPGF